jgi:hypothetical protein
MFYIRAVFDMVILHHDEIADDDGGLQDVITGKGILIHCLQSSGKRLINSWITLRQDALSDAYVHAWTSWMIKQQKGSQ